MSNKDPVQNCPHGLDCRFICKRAHVYELAYADVSDATRWGPKAPINQWQALYNWKREWYEQLRKHNSGITCGADLSGRIADNNNNR